MMNRIILLFTLCSSCVASSVKYEEYGFQEEKIYYNLNKALQNRDEVKILDLSRSRLDRFPEEILLLKNLKVLNLSYNKIGEIPTSIIELKELEILIIIDGKLNQLPENIGQLEKIKVINLMKNELSELPESIRNLKCLKKLYLPYNHLSEKDVEPIRRALPEANIVVDIIL